MSAHDTLILSLDKAADRIKSAREHAKTGGDLGAAVDELAGVVAVHNLTLKTIIRAFNGDERAIRELTE